MLTNQDDFETRMRQIAQEVYSTLGTQYAVANVPTHTHNNIDTGNVPASSVDAFLPLPATSNGIASPGILGSQVINDPNQASNLNLAGKFNSATIYVNPIPILYGQSNGLLTITSMPASGATSAALSTAYPYETGTRQTTFINPNNDTRAVLYTKGSTSITWTPGLSGNTTSTSLSVNGSPYAFAGGDAPAGSMIFFTNPAGAQNQLWVRVNTIPGFSSGTFALTGSLLTGATSATLSSFWPYISGTAWIRFSNGEIRPSFFTSGSTSITFSAITSSATNSITISAVGWRGIEMNLLLPTF